MNVSAISEIPQDQDVLDEAESAVPFAVKQYFEERFKQMENGFDQALKRKQEEINRLNQKYKKLRAIVSDGKYAKSTVNITMSAIHQILLMKTFRYVDD